MPAFLKIENVGVCPPEGFTVLGVSLADTCDRQGVIGQFGSGNKHGVAVWREARAEKREPTYVWHEGKYEVKALAEEVGDWNQMIAAFSGALSDALEGSGVQGESAIAGFPNFEKLEFHGSQDERIQPFLQTMKAIAKHKQEPDVA